MRIRLVQVVPEGNVRFPPRMLRAISGGPFTGTQIRVLLALMTLANISPTGSVRISHAELATNVAMRQSGGFAAAMRELISRRVLVMVDRGGGRRPPAYKVERDVCQWRGPAGSTWSGYAVS